MATRKMINYLKLTHDGRGNMKYSARSAKGKQRKPPPTIFHQLRDFLGNNIAWILHNWRIKKRCAYPTTSVRSIHPLRSHTGNTAVTICVAADWATGTAQSVFVGQKMADHTPDYTIHLGDTYYSGTAPEHADNFGAKAGDPDDAWPRGKMGSFALTGNHEMFSSGQAYMDLISNPLRGFGETLPGERFTGQEAPFCCLGSEDWCILCLDTGYDSLFQQWYKRIFNSHPNDPKLELPPLLMQWLETTVDLRNDKRGIIVLTHHQYITAFDDEDEFQEPARQLQTLLPSGRAVIWISGHEHRFAMYNKYRQSTDHITAYVRCIGNGGMVDEHTPKRILNAEKARSRGIELYDHRIADTFHFDFSDPLDIGYNCYAQLQLDGDKLQLTFFGAYFNGAKNTCPYHEPMITEHWQADKTTGAITRLEMIDHTIDGNGKSGLEFPLLANRISAALSLLVFLVASCFFSCKPKVFLFTARPAFVTSADSVHFDWKTRGKPVLVGYPKKMYVAPDSVPGMEFVLTAVRGDKQSAPMHQQVAFAPAVFRDELVLNLTNQLGDTLIYSGVKDTGKYAAFTVLALMNTTSRPVTLVHAGTACPLAAACMQGASYAGPWEFHLKITPQEQQDKHTIPNSYILIAHLKKN